MIDVLLPKVDQDMTTAVFVEWLVEVGAEVKKGQGIATIETAKVNIEVESPADGVLVAQLVESGAEVPVGAVIGRVAAIGEEAEQESRKGEGTPAVAHAGELLSPGGEAGPTSEPGVGTKDEVSGAAVVAQTPTPAEARGELQVRVKRRREGPHAESPRRRYANERATAERRIIPFSATRRTMIETVVASNRVPQYQLSADIPMGAAVSMIKDLKGRDCEPLSLTDVILKAAARSAEEVPMVRALYSDEGLEIGEQVDVNLLVPAGDELFNPCIRSVARLSLFEIGQERRRLVQAASERRLSREDLAAGGFTLSNLGRFPVDQFTAMLFPPQVMVIAVGRARCQDPEMPAWVTLSLDHRALSGHVAASYLGKLLEALTHPAALLVNSPGENPLGGAA